MLDQYDAYCTCIIYTMNDHDANIYPQLVLFSSSAYIHVHNIERVMPKIEGHCKAYGFI